MDLRFLRVFIGRYKKGLTDSSRVANELNWNIWRGAWLDGWGVEAWAQDSGSGIAGT